MKQSYTLAKYLFFALMVLAVIIALIFYRVEKNRQQVAETVINPVSDDTVLVIDPGHGGEDGGAAAPGGVTESSINLDIGLKLASLTEFCALPRQLTRSSQEIDYPPEANTVSKRKTYDLKQRARLTEDTENAVLISIHQNFYPHGSPKGPQVFYSKNQGSLLLAELTQQAVNRAVWPENKRVATPVSNRIFLFKNVSCPAILAECGFLSNKQEALLLQRDSYRLRLALAMLEAYCTYIDQ